MTAVRSSFYVALTYFLGVHSSLEGSLSVEYIPLDGDALYEFSWAGSPAAAHAEDVAALRPSDESLAVDDEQLLPNQLLPAGYTEEVVSMVTAQHEKYKCVLPHSRTNEDGEVCIYIKYQPFTFTRGIYIAMSSADFLSEITLLAMLWPFPSPKSIITLGNLCIPNIHSNRPLCIPVSKLVPCAIMQ